MLWAKKASDADELGVVGLDRFDFEEKERDGFESCIRRPGHSFADRRIKLEDWMVGEKVRCEVLGRGHEEDKRAEVLPEVVEGFERLRGLLDEPIE